MRNKIIFVFSFSVIVLIVSCKSAKEGSSALEKKPESVEKNTEKDNIASTDRKTPLNHNFKASGPVRMLKNDKHQITDIYFYDEKSGELISEYNIDSNNPYKTKYKDDLITNLNQNYVKFDSEKPLSELCSKDDISNYNRSDLDAVVTGGYLTTRTYLYDNSAVVGYNYYLGDGVELVGINSTIRVFNSKGDQVFKLEDVGVNVNNAAVSKDGQYLAFTYGIDDEGGYLLSTGYRIYNILDGTLLFDDKVEKNITSDIPINIIDDGFLFKYHWNDSKDGINKKRVYTIIDVYGYYLYRYEYKLGRGSYIKQTNMDGTIIMVSNDRETTIHYKDFFTKHKIELN